MSASFGLRIYYNQKAKYLGLRLVERSKRPRMSEDIYPAFSLTVYKYH
jgi:hypothetical protein